MKEYEVRTFLKSYIGKVVPNYIVPGLTSSLVGGVTPRMFSMTRPQELFVAPHNHRYDFACYVLRGRVVNVMYEPTADYYKTLGVLEKEVKEKLDCEFPDRRNPTAYW